MGAVIRGSILQSNLTSFCMRLLPLSSSEESGSLRFLFFSFRFFLLDFSRFSFLAIFEGPLLALEFTVTGSKGCTFLAAAICLIYISAHEYGM